MSRLGDRSAYPRHAPAIVLGIGGLGVLMAGLFGASTAGLAAAWVGLAVLLAAARVRRTKSSVSWFVLAALLIAVLAFVSVLVWIYVYEVPIGS